VPERSTKLLTEELWTNTDPSAPAVLVCRNHTPSCRAPIKFCEDFEGAKATLITKGVDHVLIGISQAIIA